MIVFERSFIQGVSTLIKIYTKLKPLDLFLLTKLQKEGLSLVEVIVQIFEIIELIYIRQEKSQEEVALVYEESINEHRVVISSFEYKINLNIKYIRQEFINFPLGTGLILFIVSIFLKFWDHPVIGVTPDDEFLESFDSLSKKYKLGENKLNIFSMGIRIYFEMYFGAKNESIFYLNGAEIIGVFKNSA
jgi:hypothetical protein